MKFAESRQVLIKHVDAPELPDKSRPETLSTPRWLSPMPGCMGFEIARLRDVLDDVPQQKLKVKRRKPRRRLPGLALKEKPWAK